MGKIIVKAQQQNVFNKDKSGIKSQAYVIRPVRYSTMSGKDIVDYCSANSNIPRSYIRSTMVAISECIENFLLNGHSVEFPGLGIFSITSNSVSETDVMSTGVEQLIKLNIRFRPNVDLKDKVEKVDVEFDGVYDIAGETDQGEKYYVKVNRSNNSNSSPSTPSTTSYTLSVSANNTSYGSVSGGGTYTAGSTATVTATAQSGYKFSQWNDGVSTNPRVVTVNGNMSLTATFVTDGGGSQGGGDVIGG